MKKFNLKRAGIVLSMLLVIYMFTLPAFAGQGERSHVTGNGILLGVGLMFGFGLVINAENLTALFKNFRTVFNDAFSAAEPQYPSIAMTVPSSTSVELYAWLGAFPKMREWVGERVLQNIKNYDWSIKNKDWEVTVTVPRNSIEDDQYGIFTPIVRAAGFSAKTHPDDIVFDLLNNGFTALGYDGKAFFATDHSFGSNKGTKILTADNYGTALAAIRRIKDDKGNALFSGTEKLTLTVPPELEATAKKILTNDYVSISGGSQENNIWKGSATPQVSPKLTSATAWFITVEFNGLKPLIFQERKKPEFVTKTDPSSSDHVFMNKEFLYGADSRDNAGYGLPQLAYGSTGLTS